MVGNSLRSNGVEQLLWDLCQEFHRSTTPPQSSYVAGHSTHGSIELPYSTTAFFVAAFVSTLCTCSSDSPSVRPCSGPSDPVLLWPDKIILHPIKTTIGPDRCIRSMRKLGSFFAWNYPMSRVRLSDVQLWHSTSWVAFANCQAKRPRALSIRGYTS